MWQPGTKGQRYKVQLSKDPEFMGILKEELLQEAEWTMQRPKQKVHFRARVIDVDGFEGDWSSTQQINPPPAPWYYAFFPLMPILYALLVL